MAFEEYGFEAQEKTGAADTTYETELPKKKKSKMHSTAVKVIALCLVCLILGGAAGFGIVKGLSGKTIVLSGAPTEVAAGSAPVAVDTDTAAGEPLKTVQTLPAVQATAVPFGGTAQETDSVIIGADYEYLAKTNSIYSGKTLSATDIFDMACNSVVGISTEIEKNIFGQVSTYAVSGTGFIISENGYVLTNYHVIEGASKVSVMLYNEEEYEAQIVGHEKENDIAVLKIDADNLTPVVLGSSAAMKVGETVYCIGNPLGELTYTMTSGIISALDREISTDEDESINMFQMDAAVNSGNSGGPVFNDKGEVIGIVTAKYASTGVEGLGFAIPVDDAVYIAEELIEHGYVSGKPYFGIRVRVMDEATAASYNAVPGVYVVDVDPGSCAEKAGLKVGDIITKLGEEDVLSISELSAAKKKYRAGDEAEVTLWRSGEIITLRVVFDEQPRDEETEPAPAEETNPSIDGSNPYGGTNPFGGYNPFNPFNW
ncbi:MAG: trypsin-like peptidase domain-containing protein [Oscillospiraceae bacterium]|nr:trypsin-like peptidase domain-containing protein [Oscillospiraceae bacterium]